MGGSFYYYIALARSFSFDNIRMYGPRKGSFSGQRGVLSKGVQRKISKDRFKRSSKTRVRTGKVRSSK